MTQSADEQIKLLRDALTECKRVIENGGDGAIVDTIWQGMGCTLVDHIDWALDTTTEPAAVEETPMRNLDGKDVAMFDRALSASTTHQYDIEPSAVTPSIWECSNEAAEKIIQQALSAAAAEARAKALQDVKSELTEMRKVAEIRNYIGMINRIDNCIQRLANPQRK